MKKLLLAIICLLTFNCTIVDAQYRINKNKYDYHRYIYQPGDPYNPSTAAAVSVMIPGLGQMISDESGRGFCFMLGTAGCLAVSFAGLLTSLNTDERDRDFQKKLQRGMTLLYTGLAGAVGTWIWSIADAPRVAKVNNMALRDKRKVTGDISIYPYLDFPSYLTNNKSSVGLTVNFNF